MTADLILAADMSTPCSPRLLPLACDVILGYVGRSGSTPHVWTPAEVDYWRGLKKRFWPIWTPPQHLLSATEAKAAAAGMMTACSLLHIARSTPVFLDIEAGTWQRDPTRAGVYLATWKEQMKRLGWTHPFGYVPLAAGCDWVAHWTGTRPQSLPDRWVGQQYANALAAGAYDLSVFDPARVGLTRGSQDTSSEIEGQGEMFIIRDASNQREYLQGNDGSLHYLGSTASVKAYTDAGVPLLTDVDPRDIRNLLGAESQ